MIILRFRKFRKYCSALFWCKHTEYIHNNAMKYYHHADTLLERVPCATAKYFYEKNYSKKLYSSVSEAPAEQEDLIPPFYDFINDHNGNGSSHYKRNFLYPESEDEVTLKLKLCTNGNDVLDIIEKVQYPSPEHLVQALLVLRDLYKIDLLYPGDVDNSLKNNPSFDRLIEQISNSVSQLNPDELSYCILYFHKFNIKKEIILSFITAYEDLIKDGDANSVSLSSLARVCITVKDFQNIWSLNTFLEFLPILTKKLDSCDNYVDFQGLTTCFQKMSSLLSSDLMKTFVEKCSMLMQRNEDTTAEMQRLRTVVKCVSFLNNKIWQGDYNKLLVDLLLSMQERIPLLTIRELHTLHTVVFDLQEPYQILRELKSFILQKTTEWSQASGDTTIDLRSAALLFMHLGTKDIRDAGCVSSVLKYLESIDIENELQFYSTNSFLHLLHHELKVNAKLAYTYWSQIANFIKKIDCIEFYETVIQMCQSYSHFSTVIGYRHAEFESNALFALQKIKEKNKFLNPNKKCLVDLLLLYMNYGRSDCLESTYEYFVHNVSRFKPSEWAVMSYVLNNVGKRTSKSKTSSLFLYYYVQMLSALNNSASEYLKANEDPKVDDMIHLFRGYCYRGGTRSTELYRLITDPLKRKSQEDFSSRKIVAVIPISYISHLFEPDIVEKMVHYFIERKNVISVFPVVQLLNYMYSFGYTPTKFDEFIDVAGQVIVRGKDELSAFYLVCAALSLSYYNYFLRELYDSIFNIQFLDFVNKEVPLMMQKRNRRFHQNFFELNRAVCLDFSNSDTPWFHEKYCKEKLTLEPRLKTEFKKEVLYTLTKLIHNEKALQVDSYSPYYHKIDFVLYTNKNGEPVDPSKYRPQDVRKIAILLNTLKTSSPYYLEKGRFDMCIRQLEMLDYKVAVIDGYLWNSMYMSETSAKEDYLCNTIWSR